MRQVEILLVFLIGSCSQCCADPEAGIRGSIDFSTDPCEDFYQFSCGKWIKNNPPKGNNGETSVTDNMEQIARQQFLDQLQRISTNVQSINYMKHLYEKCMDTETVKLDKNTPIHEEIKKIGGWPMLQKTADSTLSLTEIAIWSEKFTPNDGLFKCSVKKGEKGLQMHIKAMNLGFSPSSVYINKNVFADMISAYKKFMTALAQIIGDDLEIDLDQNLLDEHVEKQFEYERTLAEIEESTLDDNEEAVPVQELQDWGLINWKQYFKGVLSEEVFNHVFGEKFDSSVLYMKKEYFRKVINFLKNVDKRLVISEAVLLMVGTSAQYLDMRFYNVYQDLKEVVQGKRQMHKDFCIDAALTMDMAASVVYTQKYFNTHDKAVAELVVSDLKDALITLIQESDWLDEDAKERGKQRLSEVKISVGYPDFRPADVDSLEKYYQTMTFETGTLFDMHQLVLRWNEYKKISSLIEQPHFSPLNPIDVKISHDDGSIAIPAAILQPPIFHSDYPRNVLYASLGALVSTTLDLMLGLAGRIYYSDGRVENWWKNETKNSYRTKLQCLAKQYSQYKVPTINMTIDGDSVYFITISDNSALQLATKAYKLYLATVDTDSNLPDTDLSDEQVFFVKYAQFFCRNIKEQNLINEINAGQVPNEIKVTGIMSNSEAFSKAYSCKAGSAMNPNSKCTVW